jgi:hypothetical protein
MEKNEGKVESVEISKLQAEIKSLTERISGLEQAHVRFNESYNRHIADLHVRKLS